jgi:chaperone modulatory protein CbpM
MEKNDLWPAEELSRHYNIEISFITSLGERGLIDIIIVEEKHYLLKTQIGNLEKMIRLHVELDINIDGIEAITHLLQRIESLQIKLATVKNKLSMYEN